MRPKSQNKQNKAKKAIDRAIDDDVRSITDGSRKKLSSIAQRYLRAIVEPGTAAKTGVPTLLGGNPGRTAIETTKAEGKFTIGNDGWGYVKVPNPKRHSSTTFGPFAGSKCLEYTTGSSFLGTDFPTTAGVAPAGTAHSTWNTVLGNPSAYLTGDLLYRLVGMSVEVFPESSFSSQNGNLTLVEFSGHADASRQQPLAFTDVVGYENSRVLRATQTGPQSEKIVANWHPQNTKVESHGGSTHESTVGDFDFKTPTAGWSALVMPCDGLCIIAEGATDTDFHYVVHAMWELKGNAVRGKKPRAVDSRGMDLVFNALNRKILDGFVAKPQHAYESYLHTAAAEAQKLGTRAAGKLAESAASASLKAIAGFL